MSELHDRAVAFEESLRDRCADRVEPFAFGHVVSTPSLPNIWDLNTLRVEEGAPDAEELATEAERILGGSGLGHRAVDVLGEERGARLAEGFRLLGWKPERYIYMQYATDLRPDAANGVEQVEQAVLSPLRELEMRLDEDTEGEVTVRQFIEWNARAAERLPVRHFAVRVDGAPVACTDLYVENGTAQVEDVFTHPEHRNRGHARAVVLHAVAAAFEAGADFVFLVADDEDWPKELYARIGFAPLGRGHAFRLTGLGAG